MTRKEARDDNALRSAIEPAAIRQRCGARSKRSARGRAERLVHLLPTATADWNARSVSKDKHRFPNRLGANFAHPIEIHDRRPVHARESHRIEPRLERR